MNHTLSPGAADNRADPIPPGQGCAGCWAAGYCVACAPASVQAPEGCPLSGRATGRPRVRPAVLLP